MVDRLALALEEAETSTEVVLVGHSAGGLLLERLAQRVTPGRVMGEVYIAALVPEPGFSLLEQMFEGQRSIFTSQWLEEIASQPRTSARFLPVLYEEKMDLPFSPERPKAYFVCQKDECICPEWQSEAAGRLPGCEVTELTTGHDPQLEAAGLLAHRLHQWVSITRVRGE